VGLNRILALKLNCINKVGRSKNIITEREYLNIKDNENNDKIEDFSTKLKRKNMEEN
jgi:hypothetical protein